MSYEAARDELAEIVGELEYGGATLEQALAVQERGEELTKLPALVDGAQARLDMALRPRDAGLVQHTSTRWRRC